MKKVIVSLMFAFFVGITVPAFAAGYEPDYEETAPSKSSKKKSSSKKSSSSRNSSSSKKWTGATSMSNFKSKISGTTWGTTTKQGDFYYAFTIKGDDLIINTYITSDFDPAGKMGNTMTEKIKEFTEKEGKSGKVFFIIAGDTSSNIFGINATILGFSSNSASGWWSTNVGTLKLKQIK